MTPCEARSVASTGGDYSVFGARKMRAVRGRPEIAERHGAGHAGAVPVRLERELKEATRGRSRGGGAPPVRLMRDMGLHGVRRAKSPRTTRSAPKGADLVNRHFSAFRPNELWVVDITYVRTMSGWVHVTFVTDVYSRRVIGQRTCTSPCTDPAAGALKMAVWARQRTGADPTGPGPSLRLRGAAPGHPLRADPGPVRGGRIRRVEGDSFRLCSGRGPQLAVQGRAHPQPSPPR